MQVPRWRRAGTTGGSPASSEEQSSSRLNSSSWAALRPTGRGQESYADTETAGRADKAGREQADTTDTTTTQRAQPGIEEDELTQFIAECLALALVEEVLEDVRADRADLYSETGEASTSPLSDTSSPTTEGGTTTEKEVEPADEVPD